MLGLYLPISLSPPEHRQLELGLQKVEFPLKGILAFLGCRLSGHGIIGIVFCQG